MGISRKSIHGKKSEAKAGGGAAPKSGPPSAFGSKMSVDRIPLVKNNTARQSSSRFRNSKHVELTKLPMLKDCPSKDRPQLFLVRTAQPDPRSNPLSCRIRSSSAALCSTSLNH